MKSILFILLGSSLYLFLNTFFLIVSDIVIGQLITGIVTIVVAYIAYRTSVKVNKVVNQVKELDIKVDGRLSQLLELTKSDERQKGHSEGADKAKAENRAENIALASDLDKQTETIIAAVKDAAHPVEQVETEPTKVVVVKPAEVIVVKKDIGK